MGRAVRIELLVESRRRQECGGSIAMSERSWSMWFYHVAQRQPARSAGAGADAFFLGHRDLHVVSADDSSAAQ